MVAWDPTRYLSFADERSRPFVELISRVNIKAERIADLGCGPGHLMSVLRAHWPDAKIKGIDSSPEMIARASAEGES